MRARRSCSSELNPKTVLHDEDKEEEDARDKRGNAQAHKVTIQVVLDAGDARFVRPAIIDGLRPWEEGRFADSGTTVAIFKELDPLLDSVKVRLATEGVSKGLEFKVGKYASLCRIFDALLIGDEVSAWKVPRFEDQIAICCYQVRIFPLWWSGDILAGAVIWAHVFVNFDGVIDVKRDGHRCSRWTKVSRERIKSTAWDGVGESIGVVAIACRTIRILLLVLVVSICDLLALLFNLILGGDRDNNGERADEDDHDPSR